MLPSAQRSSPSLPRTPLARAARIAAFGAALAALAAAGVPLCPVAAVARVPCPGCGLSRATLALLHGNLGEALRLHPLAPLVAPLGCGFVAYACFVYVRHGRWPGASGAGARWIAIVGIAMWTLLVGVWIARFHGAFGGPAPV
jgi:hypothetical protein